MDVVRNLDKILRLVLKGDDFERNKHAELTAFRTKPLHISKSIDDDEYTRAHLEEVLTSTELLLKIFLNNYETRFNVLVEYIFYQIQNILHSAISGNAQLVFSHNHLFNIIELLVEITITYPCDTNILTLTNFYKWNVHEIKLKHNTEYDSASWVYQELAVRLRIISVIYGMMCSSKESKRVRESHCVEELVKCIITDNYESELLKELVCKHSEPVMIQTVIDIIPKFIAITRNSEIIQLIWEEICNLYNISNNVDISRIFIMFCYLSDFYFSADNKQIMTNIFTNNIYWTLLQNGLVNPDSAVRKQALFLIKNSLNYIVENNINFYCSTKEIDAVREGERLTRKLPLIYWEFGMKFDELREMCVIVEYLEEKQVHIVRPIFSKIEKFLNNILEQKLDVSWILIIIQRMLSHDNMKIIRQGISNLVKINVNSYNEEYTMVKAVKLLIKSLNCTQIYMMDLSALLEELKTYFENCSVQENGKHFFRILIQEMSDVPWSSEALFCVTYSLHSIRSKKFWEIEEVNLLKKLITSGTANHYTYIKSGMECHLLLAGINLIDTCCVSLEDIHSLLNCYNRKISLQRKTLLWECVLKWIRNIYTLENVQHFILNAMGNRNIGRMMVLLYDSYSDDEKFKQEMQHLLKKISAKFIGLHARLYSDKQLEESCLSIICDIIEESSGDGDLFNIFSPVKSDIVLYIELELKSIHHVRDFQRCKVLMKNLNTILNHDRQSLILSNMMGKWFDKTVTDLSDSSKRTLPVQRFIQIRLLNMIMDYIPCKMHGIELYLREELNSPLIRTVEDLTLTKDLQTLWGRMNSEYLRGKWELLSKIGMPPSKVLHVNNAEFISCCFEALDLSGYAVLLPFLSVLEKALPSLVYESRLKELIDSTWNIVMERKKNEEFQSLIKQFVAAVFQLEVIKVGNDIIRRMLVDYSQRILSENPTAAAVILVKQMQKIGLTKEVMYFFEDFLPRTLLFGQMVRKEERLIREVCSLIETSGLSPLMNDFSTSNDVRARSVQIILTLNPKNEADCRFAENLVETLKSLEESNSRNKARYFSDSYVHRVKQRLFQALLILEPCMTKEGSEKLWNWLSNKILLENNQSSVRYLQEWLMLRILRRNPRFRNAVWGYFDEALEKRTGSLCSLISIIYHSLKCIPSGEIANLMDRAVETFLPYCMAQHFSVRLYAQFTLVKLLGTAEKLCLKTITENYDLIKKSLEKSIERGNAVKNCAKLQEDFYFAVFDPVQHYSLQTIFFELPRLTNGNGDELISEDLFRKIGIHAENCYIPLANTDDSLMKFTCGRWILDGSKQDNFMEESEEREEWGTLNLQKKMIPAKCLIPDREELFQSVSLSSKKIEKDGLVVVASLIDRIPNLGGLSRTCEIFGACELVIASLKYTEDKQFQSLSVTAEKWIAISEVKPFYLSDYLIKMKKIGYTVLAAEQTINSQSLQCIKFPKKSLLLLGNEKEGIPPTLLPLMDICVEIPQIGVIRSLNVHVTGALFVWEYAKQHHFPK